MKLLPQSASSLLLTTMAAIAAFTLTDAASSPATAQGARIEGTWSGAGRMILSSGNSERVRCRATFRRQASRTFGMVAVCASPSARVAQTASVQQVAPGRYAGRFYNREYDISGTVRVSVRGNRLGAYLSGSGASASLTLTR